MASYPNEEPPSTEGLDDYQFTFSCSSKTTPSTGAQDSFIEPDVRLFLHSLCLYLSWPAGSRFGSEPAERVSLIFEEFEKTDFAGIDRC